MAESVDMSITTLLDIGIAHELSGEGIFNKYVLALGNYPEENIVFKLSEGRIIDQVHAQVRLTSFEEIANQSGDADILDLQ